MVRGLPAPRPCWVQKGDGWPLGARVQGGGPAQVVCPQGPVCLSAQPGQLCPLHSSQSGRDKSWDQGRRIRWAVWGLGPLAAWPSAPQSGLWPDSWVGTAPWACSGALGDCALVQK